MKKLLTTITLMIIGVVGVKAATTQVHADFSNVQLASEAKWDATTQTLTWTKQYGNQVRNLGLPTGDLSDYEKIVVECEDLNASSFRLLIYNGDANTTIVVNKTGVSEFILTDYVSKENLKNVTEVVLSGGNQESEGSVRIIDLYLQTYDDAIQRKSDPTLSFTPSTVRMQPGDAFVPPVFNNPDNLPVTFSVQSSPDGFVTVDAATDEVKFADGEGTATVTASFAGNDSFNEGSASYNIIVKSAVVPDGLPFVYDVENTGVMYPEPVYPVKSQLPFVEPLTDPLLFSDWSGRVADFTDWARRRSEIFNEIQHYEVGSKPAVNLDDIEASMNGNTLKVTVKVNGKSITISGTINYPSTGQAPYPLMIITSSSSISLPAGLARMTYSESQLNGYGQFGDNGSREFERLYPELSGNGAYSEWAWGFSRLLDGLQKLGPEVTKIDMARIGVTGCSYAGKMALFCGAMDERVALTIPQEPGGGGVAAWRCGNWMGNALGVNVEKIANTDYNWSMTSLRNNFNGDDVSYLPYDHHELVSLICPRAVLMIGNPSQTWLGDPSGYISINAARKVWEQFGIADRCGYSFVGHGDHCSMPSSQYPEFNAFVNRFLFGQEDVETDIQIAPQNYIDTYDTERWTSWWGTDQQPPIYLPGSGNEEDEESVWIEAEDMISTDNGQNFSIVEDASCGGGKYVETVVDAPSLSEDRQNRLIASFNIEKEANYNLYARVNTGGKYDDDSYFIAYDDEEPRRANGLAAASSSWAWLNLGNYVDDGSTFSTHLMPGEHKVTIIGRENGAKIDLVKISTSRIAPDANVLAPTAIKQVAIHAMGAQINKVKTEDNTVYVSLSAAQRQQIEVIVHSPSGSVVAKKQIRLDEGDNLVELPVKAYRGVALISIKNAGGSVCKSVLLR